MIMWYAHCATLYAHLIRSPTIFISGFDLLTLHFDLIRDVVLHKFHNNEK